MSRFLITSHGPGMPDGLELIEQAKTAFMNSGQPDHRHLAACAFHDRRSADMAGIVPPAGLEPAHPAPEAGALSSELRGPCESAV
jgi:hypothetical protein